MGVITDYFLAADDEAALAAIEPVGGPGGVSSISTDVVALKGVMPMVELAELVALLTGRPVDEVGPIFSSEPLAIIDDGEQLLFRVPDEAVDALAAATDAQIATAAPLWMRDQYERWPTAPGDDPRPTIVGDLVSLARRRDAGVSTYCWMCV